MSFNVQDSYHIFPLGDSAATLELGTEMNEAINRKVLSIGEWFEENKFNGVRDVVVAYSSITLFYDPFVIQRSNNLSGSTFSWIEEILQKSITESSESPDHASKTITIPVCYDPEFGVDQEYVSQELKMSIDDIIGLHHSKKYRVYMLGFLPGFGYLGELDPRLILPRKEYPVMVTAGSVAIASNQTAVYPIASPGGWHVIGRTPMRLFNAMEEVPVHLQAGDEIAFVPITKAGFERLA